MLRIILNRLNPIEEYILAEEKAGFRKKRSTIEHILNSSNLYVSSLNHYMEESKHSTTDKNATVQLTNIVYTTSWLRNLDKNRKTGKKNYCILA